MRVTTKGQVTIPVEIREQLDITPSSEVEFEVVGNVAQLRKVSGPSTRGGRVMAALRAAPYRGPSTDELMAFTRGDDRDDSSSIPT
jgi:AbrB family looped-hinge helix DNA binding protein